MAEEMNKETAEEVLEEAVQTEAAAEEKAADEIPAEAAEEEAPTEEKSPEKKKGLFRNDRAEKAEKALAQAGEQLKDMTDRAQRTMAEFDNYRKRTDKEKAAMYDIGARNVLEKVLPVVDSFERGLGGLSEEQKAEPFADGMDKVYKQLIKVLDELEVKPIEAVGQPFDPDKHNAVMHEEDESQGENLVIQEFLKGYTYKGTVIRYSMVKVVN